MNKIVFWAIGIVILLLLVYSLISRSSTITFAVAKNSSISTDATVSLSSDHYKARFPLPKAFKLRPGRYTLEFRAKGAETITERLWIFPFTTKTIETSFSEEELPNKNDVTEIPYLSLFPHETGDYIVTMKIDEVNGKRTATGITIGIYHRFASPSDGQLYVDERNQAVEQAKKWLSQNKIPNTIPITVTDSPLVR